MPLNNSAPNPRRPVPWSLGLAFAIFTLYFVVTPLVTRGFVYPLERFFPSFENDPAAVVEDVPDGAAESQAPSANETPDASEGTEPDAATPSQEETSDAAETINDVLQSDKEKNASDGSVFDPQEIATQHPLARLLIRSYFTPYFGIVVAIFFVTVVLLAPLVEEFVFRVTLQGAVESAFRVHETTPDPNAPATPLGDQTLEQEEQARLERRRQKDERARKLRVAAAIVLPALIFATLHAGLPEDPENPEPIADLFHAMVSTGIANILAFVLGVMILVRRAGATRVDLGLEPRFSGESVRRFARDWSLGVLLLAIGTPIILGVNAVMERLFEGAIVAPIPIFVFALYEGVVYYRSRKFATVLGMHMALNMISFLTLISLVLSAGQ